MRVAVVSSVYGGHDNPVAPVPQDIDCEWVLVTDTEVDCPPWRTIIEPRPSMNPRLAGKVAKCRPDLYADADVYVWIDASFRVTSPGFVSWAISHLDRGLIAQIPHPQRTRITDEAEACAGRGDCGGLPLREQAAYYIARGYPDGWGLWASGLIAYSAQMPFETFGNAWLFEQFRWTFRDQLSQAPLLHRFGIRPVDMAGPLLGNSRFEIRGHAK